MPVITLIDTAGAYPGIGAEERGQAEAIARSTDCCLRIGVPLITVVIGEGGSGGAIAIATANRILMLEHAIYTVASPEAAASILWRDSAKAIDAATNMKITAQDLDQLGVIDVIITEPVGGAHRDRASIMKATGDAIARALAEFDGQVAGRHPQAAPRPLHADRPGALISIAIPAGGAGSLPPNSGQLFGILERFVPDPFPVWLGAWESRNVNRMLRIADRW